MRRLLVLSACLALGLTAMTQTGLASPDCGPGMYVGKSNKGSLIQSLGATTNASLLPTQTFAMTSGTSGCSSSGVVNRDVEQEVFVAVNMDSLYQDMARGQGEYLESLADLMGCKVAVRGELGRMARDNFADLHATAEDSPSALLANLRTEMARRPALAAGCSRLS